MNRVTLRGSEAWSNGLAPIGFYFDRTGTGMTVRKFPEPDCYLEFVRPPSGSVKFSVHSYNSEEHGHAALEKAIRNYFQGGEYQPLTLGKKTNLEIDGVIRYSRILKTGEGISHRQWVATIMPSPDGGPYGLILLFGVYTDNGRLPNDPKRVLNQELRAVAKSFHLAASDEADSR